MQFKETKRALLREKQEQELAELEEKLMEKRYILMRANDSHQKTYGNLLYTIEIRALD